MSIIIFSKPVHSGKTTELILWCNQQKNKGGILMPDINGKRKMIDVRTSEIFEAEADSDNPGNETLINIGRYNFYASSFEKANSIILNELILAPGWIVIDEVGSLEMQAGGFLPALKKIIPIYQDESCKQRLLLVIRDSLVQPVLDFFEIKNPAIINTMQGIEFI